ncbi:MAG: metallophosphoesterase [Longimicrobiales bacterium]|nr:metallophosphoesterase [Longimicrobiales bacterium]
MSAKALTVLHTSDYQVGRPFLPAAADAMIALADQVRPDVVVAAGDLTQRARKGEFRQAKELLERFGDVPVVTTPGNHDIPVYRTLERLAAPYRNWRRFSGERELDSVTRVDGATFVALSSAEPFRAVVAGRLRARQMAFAHEAFRRAPVGDHRIVVVHHHFVPVPEGGAGRPLPGAAELLREFEKMGVSAILGGHVHQLHLRSSSELTGSPRSVPVLSTGTATSRRGRGGEVEANSLCVLRFTAQRLEVTPYVRAPEGDSFEAREPRHFDLDARQAVAGAAEEGAPAAEEGAARS